jgi:hypothetical protein
MDPKYIARRGKLIEILSKESLFILSRLSTCHSMKLSVRVNPQEKSIEKVKLLLNGSHLKSRPVRPQRHHRDDHLE